MFSVWLLLFIYFYVTWDVEQLHMFASDNNPNRFVVAPLTPIILHAPNLCPEVKIQPL